MPVFKSDDDPPRWCELEYFDIVHLSQGEEHVFDRMGRKEKLIVCSGSCDILDCCDVTPCEKGANMDIAGMDGRFAVINVREPTTIVRMAGRWGDEVGGSGIFTGDNVDTDGYSGDAPLFPKRTDFDNHYHDCDEYWIVFKGSGVAVSEGLQYELGVGDCLATGMGQHHDLIEVHEPLGAVYFETTMEGRKRKGHLWNIDHGPAEPKEDRV